MLFDVFIHMQNIQVCLALFLSHGVSFQVYHCDDSNCGICR